MKQYADAGIRTLQNALFDHMNSDDLKKLGALTKQKLPSRKGDLVDVITRHLEGDGLQTAWRGLDELQRAAVAEVVHSEETYFPADLFRAKYGRDPVWESNEENRYYRKPSPLCFFFYKGIMPDDLKARLKTFVAPPTKAKIASLDRVPDVYDVPYRTWNASTRSYQEETEAKPLTVHETERAAQRELLAVLRLIDAGKVAVSDKTRRPSGSTLDAIAAVLDGSDYYPPVPVKSKWDDENAGPIRAFAWPLLVQAGGLAQLSGSRLQLTRAGRQSFSEPPAGTIRMLWKKWLITTIIDELSRIECVKGQTGKGQRTMSAVAPRRTAIAGALSECPAGVWISTDDFFRFIRASGATFIVTRNSWSLYICDPHYGSLGSGCGWILEERYLLGLLLEYAATLGLLDVALIPAAGARPDYGDLWGTDELPFFSRYDGLMYFRINPLGEYCFGMAPAYQSAPLQVKPVLRILPNLEIAAIGPDLEQGDRLALDTYATRVSEYVWRLDSGKLLAAIEEGRPVAEIREFLAARSGTEIPDAVARLLDDAAERSVKLQDRGPARLIECADPALAALLANDSRIRKYCMRAGDRHLAVPASSETAFKRAVKEAGYLVLVGETASRARAPQSRRASPPNGERGRAGESPVNETGEAGVGSAQRDELVAGVPSTGPTVGPASNILQALEAQAGD
ncbi:MAG: hypothetical protein AUH28_01535 [Acidobacteria bacterium 13_1_40CM_56_16]|nr:MAG: hypothetical protein AUH28_01535 [Acidobacteria bacterium 13_1_40CM_56_16]